MTASNKLRRRCQGMLRRKFPEATIRLTADEGSLIGGIIVDDRFRNMPGSQRQQWLDRALYRKLSPDERVRVGTITAFSPDELGSGFPHYDDYGWEIPETEDKSDPLPF